MWLRIKFMLNLLIIVHIFCALACIIIWLVAFDHKKTSTKEHLFVICGSFLFSPIFIILLIIIYLFF